MSLARTVILCWAATLLLATAAHAAESSPFKLAGKEVFVAGRPGVRIVGQAFYTRAQGQEMISRYSEQTKSDKADIAYQRFSTDNGKTWSAPSPLVTSERVSGRHAPAGHEPGFVDPSRDVLFTMIQEAILPTDNPLEGMKHWTLHYALSRDGGRTSYHERPGRAPGAPSIRRSIRCPASGWARTRR